MLMDQALAGAAVAILVANGFEEREMTEAQRALLKAGAKLRTLSPDQGVVNGWHDRGWGHFFPIDGAISEAMGSDYDMLLLPGGERSVNKLAANPHTRRIVGHFLDAGKPVAAIGQGAALVIHARKLRGRRMAVPAELRTALEEAGGVFAEDEVLVVDGPIISAQGNAEVTEFVETLLRVFAEFVQMKKAA